MNCFGKHRNNNNECFLCVDEDSCKRHSIGGSMYNNVKVETGQEREQRLSDEWLKKLPCYTCHPKMQRLCKHYNTFKRPDYNYEQFKLGAITCDDYMDRPAEVVPTFVTPDIVNKPDIVSTTIR